MPSLRMAFTLYSFNKYLLNIYYVLDTTLGDERHKTSSLPPWHLYTYREREGKSLPTNTHIKHVNMVTHVIKTTQDNGTESNAAQILPSQSSIPQ